MRIKSTQRSIRTRVNEDTLSNRVEKLHYPRCLVIVKKKKRIKTTGSAWRTC